MMATRSVPDSSLRPKGIAGCLSDLLGASEALEDQVPVDVLQAMPPVENSLAPGDLLETGARQVS